MAELRQRHGLAGRGRDRKAAEAGELGAVRQRHLQDDIGRLEHVAALDVADLETAHGHGEVLIDGVHRDAAAHGLLGVDVEAPELVGLSHVVVHVDDVLDLVEHRRHVRRDLAPRLGVGPVHLRHDGLQHRRSRGHLDDGDLGAESLGQRGKQLPGRNRDLVAAPLPLLLVLQHHQEVALPGVLAQVVMADHAVEIERLCRARRRSERR